jgi:hypothetical protein
MKQIRMIILLLTVCSILYACPKKTGHQHITFINKSDREVVCQPHYLTGDITSEDILFQCRKGANGILSGSSYYYSSGRYSDWETDFNNGILFVQFLIMDAEIYDSYITAPCDTIRKYVPILHRYQLTLEDLQRMNWTVVYPPE